jgi:hypothetical protein
MQVNILDIKNIRLTFTHVNFVSVVVEHYELFHVQYVLLSSLRTM